jgi:hypothetical protein
MTTIVTIKGKPVIDIYESFDGSYWFITEKCHKQDSVIDGKVYKDDQILFGYARLSMCPEFAEFGYVSETELKLLGNRVWKVPRRNWAICPEVEVVDKQEQSAAGEEIKASQPLKSYSNKCEEVIKMQLKESEKAIRADDFSIGDSFWIGDFEFEVVNRKNQAFENREDEVVFRWELTRGEFVQMMKHNFPQVKNPGKFVGDFEADIVRYFEKGFDALVGECGATYETIMKDAMEEVLRQDRAIVAGDENGI